MEMLGSHRRVLAGQEMSASDVDLFRQQQILEVEDQIVMFYSRAEPSESSKGSVLTNNGVIGYKVTGDVLNIASAGYSEIVNIRIVQRGSLLKDTRIEVLTNDDYIIDLTAPRANAGDLTFCCRDGAEGK